MSSVDAAILAARNAISSCSLGSSARAERAADCQSPQSALEALALVKSALMSQAATDAELQSLDLALCLVLDLTPPLGRLAQSELFSLLPAQRVEAFCSGPEMNPSADGSPNPLHWICQQIGARGLISNEQRDLFAPRQIDLLEQSLIVCAQKRPDWVNGPDATGQSPLHWAVYFLAQEAITPLLRLGANPHLPNSFGSPPFDPDFFRLYLTHAERADDTSPLARHRAEAIWRLMERHCIEHAIARAPLNEEEGSGSKRL